MIGMRNKYKWGKRKVRYYVNRSLFVRVLRRVYYEIEELFWLGIGVGILVVVVNLLIL